MIYINKQQTFLKKKKKIADYLPSTRCIREESLKIQKTFNKVKHKLANPAHKKGFWHQL